LKAAVGLLGTAETLAAVTGAADPPVAPNMNAAAPAPAPAVLSVDGDTPKLIPPLAGSAAAG